MNHLFRARLPAAPVLAFALLTLAANGPADAASIGLPNGFIPVAQPLDIAYDAGRDTLYITTATKVLRYSLTDRRFEAPILFGSDLKGIDLAPDGTFIAVADDSTDGASTWVYIVDTDGGDVTKVLLPASFYESGTWSVAIVDDRTLLTTSDFAGSGWVPFRRIDLVTGEIEEIATVTQWTMLASNRTRDIIGLAQGNISDGRWGRYTVSTDTYEERDWYEDGTAWFNYEVAINGAGDQIAIPTYGGTFLFDSTLHHAGVLGKYATNTALGAAYDPVDDSLYLSIADSSRIDHYDPVSRKRLDSIDIHHQLDLTGNFAYVNGRMRFSPDGTLLFVTTKNGIVVVKMRDEPANARPRTMTRS